MKTPGAACGIGNWVFLTTFLLLFTSGCATQKIDWNARVGNYTYDQAVVDLGPPDKYARLSDGGTVAEWLTHRGYSYAYPAYGYPYSPWYYGPYYPPYVSSSTPDYFIRLTFGPDGLLTSWKKLYK
jgi:hypothetical protein